MLRKIFHLQHKVENNAVIRRHIYNILRRDCYYVENSFCALLCEPIAFQYSVANALKYWEDLLETVEMMYALYSAKNCPAGIYLFKISNRNTGTMCKICLKLTIKTAERRQWRRSAVFIVNFKQIYHIVPVFLLLTLNK